MEDLSQPPRPAVVAAPLTLRPVSAADAEALANLVVQLLDAEVPGSLRGPRPAQQHLFRHLLAHELAETTRGRFLACGEGGAPLGSASMRQPGDLGATTLPPDLLAIALRTLGPLNTARFFGTMLRGSLTGETPLRRGECFFYSVIVDEAHRGRGVGRTMMGQLEERARAAGARTALLRVIVGNAPARRLYLGLGYRVVGRTPPWADRLILPSELLRKDFG